MNLQHSKPGGRFNRNTLVKKNYAIFEFANSSNYKFYKPYININKLPKKCNK